MNVFDIISLLGGLALFLYGMRLMGNNLKEGSSGALKVVMEKFTDNPIKSFLLGVVVTAIIQSSTATIVITSGLVAAGILALDHSFGIIIGANVGTTVTGQIIRLLDLNSESNSFLEAFKPSTLAPVALIVGIIFIMFVKWKKSDTVGGILMGFGILFTGLMNMTAAVGSLSESGMLEGILSKLGDSPVIAYLSGAGVAFALQSSSATIGILQAFSTSGGITFKALYPTLVGIYLGDCVTTAIVCSIGAKADAKRVGMVNILFNLSETVLVLVVVTIIHKFGLLDSLWDRALSSGGIANTNTVFNLGCAILLLPLVKVYGKLSRKIVKDDKVATVDKYVTIKDALNPVFFSTPALAFRSCYDVLCAMFTASCANIDTAFGTMINFDQKAFDEVAAEEDNIDSLADSVGNYMVKLSPYVSEADHIVILDQYYKLVTEFERLGDYAMNIAECGKLLDDNGVKLSDEAIKELDVVKSLLDKILSYTKQAFERRNVAAAHHIEPLEEVMDDVINALHDNHLNRLRDGKCTLTAGTCFLDLLSNIERISDTCSNVGVSTVARVNPEIANKAHTYISSLHQGNDADFNAEYNAAHDLYFGYLKEAEAESVSI